jgi:hypothetical protein
LFFCPNNYLITYCIACINNDWVLLRFILVFILVNLGLPFCWVALA